MARYLSRRDIDWPLLLITMLVCAVGVLQIYSATRDTSWHDAWWKQVVYVFAGLALMWMIMVVDYHALLRNVPIMYILSVMALAGTYIIGKQVFGSRRWIPLTGGFHLQVSEFVKLVIILLVARYLTELKKDELDLKEMLKLSGLILVPAMLVMKQPGSRDLVDVPGYPDCRRVSRRIAVEVYRRHCSSDRAGSSRELQFVEAVSEGAAREFHGSGARSAGNRIPADPVSDRRRGRRDVRQRAAQGNSNAVALLAGAAHGLYLFGLRRRARFRGRHHGVVVVFRYDHARRSECADRGRSLWDVYLHGSGRLVAVPHADQRRNGRGTDASDGDSASVYECRRFQSLVEFLGFGAGQ